MTVGDSNWWDTALSEGVDAANAQDNVTVATTSDQERADALFKASQQAEWTPGIPVVTPDGSIFRTTYSQYWMDPAYTGSEPTIQEKSAYSTADYARNFAGTLADLADTLNAGDVSKNIAWISDHYPSLTTANPTTGTTTAPITRQIAEDQVVKTTTTKGTPTSADDLVTELTNGADTLIAWVRTNLLYVIIAIAAIIIIPRLIPSGRRSRA